jgi:hypothetical protein
MDGHEAGPRRGRRPRGEADDVTQEVTPDVTGGATRPEVTTQVTKSGTDGAAIDLLDPQAFTFTWPPVVTNDATPDVIQNAIATEVAGQASDQGEGASGESRGGGQGEGDDGPESQPKTKIMRDLWDRERAQGRFPSVTELAEAAGAHHSLASRHRKTWVDELPWWHRRKAEASRREKATV